MHCVKETRLISIKCGSIDFAILECGLVEVKLLIKNVNLTYVFSYKNTLCERSTVYFYNMRPAFGMWTYCAYRKGSDN